MGKNIHPNIPKVTGPATRGLMKTKFQLLQGHISSFALPFHLHIPHDGDDY